MMPRWMLVFLLCPAAASAQPMDVLKVDRWLLSFHFSAHGTYSTPTNQVTEDIDADGTATLDRVTNKQFEGPPTTSVHYQYDGRLELGPTCAITVTIDDRGMVEKRINANLVLFPQGFQIDLGTDDVEVMRTQQSCAPPEPMVRLARRDWGVVITDFFPYPTSGASLSGTYHKTGLIHPDVTSNDGMAMTNITVTFQLTPLSTEELEVLLDDTETTFENWRPTLEADRRPGPSLPVRAKLVGPRGTTPTARIRHVRWSLAKTSREPGVAMNMPIDAQDTAPDLKLSPGLGRPGTPSEEDQVLERDTIPVLEDTIEIVPYDWGGWSKVELEVTLDDGRKIKAKTKSDQSEGLRIPKRLETSYIADAWKRAAHAEGLADASDSDAEPSGDGTPGDGLTLYQEYRGFYVQGAHVDGSPQKKELFVAELEHAGAGISMFEMGTGILAHTIKGNEMTSLRVVNGNKKDGPGSTVQHGVKMQMGGFANPKPGLAGEAVGGPGTPKAVDYIALALDLFARAVPNQLRTVAHELSHAVNVYHHGDTDEIVRWEQQADGSIEEKGAANLLIGLETEDHHEVTLTATSALAVIGAVGGESSGDDTCWMRYIWATAYVSKADPTIRYTQYTEAPGFTLCTANTGTGVNSASRTPQSRYGDATRGNCSAQIRVRDP